MERIRIIFRNLISRLVGSNKSATSFSPLQERRCAAPSADGSTPAVNELQEKNEPLCLSHMSQPDSKHPESGKSDAFEAVDGTLTIAIIGPAGSGKSATGNTILGKDAFESVRSMATTTKCTLSGETVEGRKIIVIDTPPLPDTCLAISCEELAKELDRCIKIAKKQANGLDAIVLTINANGRFTEEIINGIEFARNLFGEKFVKLLIIVFTREDQFSLEKFDLKKSLYSDDIPNYLKELFKNCNKRVLTINNKAGSEGKKRKVNEITDLIDEMKKDKDSSLDDFDVMSNQSNAVQQYEKACMEMQENIRTMDSISFSEQCCIS